MEVGTKVVLVLTHLKQNKKRLKLKNNQKHFLYIFYYFSINHSKIDNF